MNKMYINMKVHFSYGVIISKNLVPNTYGWGGSQDCVNKIMLSKIRNGVS